MAHIVGDDLPIPCPRPAEWTPGAVILACARAADEPQPRANAPAAASNFRVHRTGARLPRRCAPAAVAAAVRATLRDFNNGRATPFARRFAPRGVFHPYTASSATEVAGRAAIAALARARYDAGDGWTASALFAPSRVGTVRESGLDPGRPVGIYRLDLLLSAPGRPLRAAAAKLVVDCRSGLVRRWVGPGAPVPD